MEGRVAESNAWGADLHVCIHTNAFNGRVTGTRVFSWNGAGRGRAAAQAVFDELAPLTPGTSDSLSTNQTDVYKRQHDGTVMRFPSQTSSPNGTFFEEENLL